MRVAAAALALGLACAGPAMAQQQVPNVLVKLLLQQTGLFGYDEITKGACRGMPTCVGGYASRTRHENCSNYLDYTGEVSFTGMNLTQSGTFQGTLRVTTPDFVRLPGGTCQHNGQVDTENMTYSGIWNLATQRGSLHIVAGPGDEANMTFTADLVAPEPVFPMAVRSQIGPQTATVTADIQFKAADVGRNGGIYVFASAPAPRVAGGLSAKAVKLGMSTKADTPCVLAQVSPTTGQLVAVSAGQMQAFVTGAFAAQGTSVSILNNTPVPGIAGATFYVGYGTSANLMLDNGIFRNTVLVPGSSTCPPLPYVTSLWWNPSESGWGLNLSHQGTTLFATLFTYDSARAPLWLVMPAGAMQPDGVSFTGALYRTTGPAFNANPFTPIGSANITSVGTMTVELTEANAATLTYTMNGTEVQKNIQRQVYGSRAAVCLPGDGGASATNYQDLWWNAAESGWGLNVTHQDNTVFGTLFTYDPAGRDLWLVMPGGTRQADGSYLGDLYRTTGSPFNAVPFLPTAPSDVSAVGTMRLGYTSGNSGTLTYTFNGTTVTKAITRQVFSTPVSACN